MLGFAIIAFVIVLIIFGPKQLPALGSALGEAIGNFKKSYRDGSTIDVTPPREKTAGKDSNNS